MEKKHFYIKKMATKDNIAAGTGFLKAIPAKHRVWLVFTAMVVGLFGFIAYEYRDAITTQASNSIE
jgi:hypothetical protein